VPIASCGSKTNNVKRSSRIAIPCPHSTNSGFVAKALPQYCRAVELAGGEAVVVGLDLDNYQIARLATTCDGVLLPGSPADINPEKYGAPLDPHTEAGDPARDNVDELLLQDAYNMHKPVLGICFGLQSLNVWRSGTLMQHLSGPVPHSSAKSDESALLHRIVLVPDSRLAASIGPALPAKLELMVNSSHHQAAGTVGDGLRAVAWSDEDRVIEAMEGTSPDHWVIAVQWHPERMPEDFAAAALFRALIAAAQERHQHPRTATMDFESLAKGAEFGKTN
jgi:putative glutamine amidotransferase